MATKADTFIVAAIILPVIVASPETVAPPHAKVPVIVVFVETVKFPLTVALPVTVEPADATVPVSVVLPVTDKVPLIAALPVTDKALVPGLVKDPTASLVIPL